MLSTSILGAVIGFTLISLLTLGYIIFSRLTKKIDKFESNIIRLFAKRTDMFPALFEVSRNTLQRHDEIFQEALQLRKKEFSVIETHGNFAAIVDIEKYIHHEINFIFQVCNKHPILIQDKNFLYLREDIIQKSHKIGENIKKHKQIITSYNKLIRIKNYSGVGLLLPFGKKETL